MKLIDILVEELPKRGGWPEGVVAITQDSDKAINNYKTADGLETNEHGTWRYSSAWEGYSLLDSDSPCLASDYDTAIITREQYEDALAAKNEGWIEWGGGECPVDPGTIVDYVMQNGSESERPEEASALRWDFCVKTEPYAIIAYRLHQPQEVAHTEAEQEAYLNECIGQAPGPLWNGESLPPVGCECEVSVDGGRSWCTYRAINEKNGARLIEIGNFTEEFQNNNWIFRPTRSEAERKRDDICDKIYGAMTNAKRKDNRSDMAEEIYDAIAAGKITGIKLED